MKQFISWSAAPSRAVADVPRGWLPKAILGAVGGRRRRAMTAA
jgi:hypothetical protein